MLLHDFDSDWPGIEVLIVRLSLWSIGKTGQEDCIGTVANAIRIETVVRAVSVGYWRIRPWSHARGVPFNSWKFRAFTRSAPHERVRFIKRMITVIQNH